MKLILAGIPMYDRTDRRCGPCACGDSDDDMNNRETHVVEAFLAIVLKN